MATNGELKMLAIVVEGGWRCNLRGHGACIDVTMCYRPGGRSDCTKH